MLLLQQLLLLMLLQLLLLMMLLQQQLVLLVLMLLLKLLKLLRRCGARRMIQGVTRDEAAGSPEGWRTPALLLRRSYWHQASGSGSSAALCNREGCCWDRRLLCGDPG